MLAIRSIKAPTVPMSTMVNSTEACTVRYFARSRPHAPGGFALDGPKDAEGE